MNCLRPQLVTISDMASNPPKTIRFSIPARIKFPILIFGSGLMKNKIFQDKKAIMNAIERCLKYMNTYFLKYPFIVDLNKK